MAGPSNIGKWSVQATIDASGMQTGANKAVAAAKGMESALEGVFGRMGAALKFPGISIGMESLTAALSLQGLRTFGGMIANAASDAESFTFLNDQLGTSVQFLAALRTMASEAGVGADKFSGAMNKLNQALGKAAMGDETTLGVFARMGLTEDAFEAGATDETIRRVLVGLSEIESRSIRSRTATEIFGREGGAAMLRLAMSSENFAASMTDIQERIGIVDFENLLRADVVFDRLGTRWETFKRDLSTGMVGILDQWIADFDNFDTSRIPLLRLLDLRDPIRFQTGFVPGHEPNRLTEADDAFVEMALEAADSLNELDDGFDHFREQALRAADAMTALAAQTRDNQGAMARTLQLAQQARSPLQIIEDRMRQIVGAGLGREQIGRLALQALPQLGPAPALGSLSAGTAEVGSIIQGSMEPVRDLLEEAIAIWQEMRDGRASDSERMIHFGDRIMAIWEA